MSQGMLCFDDGWLQTSNEGSAGTDRARRSDDFPPTRRVTADRLI
ncbi:hypothetical protein C357_17208 [Citreicella sp. 357]|nr:hypothetical protein C357_17208 [Citreicella sp. 357]